LPASAHPESASNQLNEGGMIALSLVRLIERNSDELAAELVVKLETSSHTTDLRKVPVEELRGRIQAGNRGREPQTSSRVTRAQCTP